MWSQHRFFLAMAALNLCLALIGCVSPAERSAAPPQPASQTAAAELQQYDLKGKVVSIDNAGKRLTVDHEAIPGFMGAMTMAYSVKDAHLLENLSVGEPITAKVVSGSGGFWLEEIAPAAKELPKDFPK